MRDGIDRQHMRLACRLAVKAAGRTSPNPLVGAVLVRGRKVIARGYHRFAGGDHAEIVVLRRAGSKARGATLYLNLEPCSHQGKTPPCTASLIRAGIKEVVAGMSDPNPLVSGRGFRQLRQAGIRVRMGVLEKECRRINEAFTKFITQKSSFVVLKLAASLEGKIATAAGDARWITDASSRRYVHRLRNQVDAVVVGVGTVIADDPQLTCRLPGGRDPWRVILDRRLRIPLSARLLHQRGAGRNIVVTALRASANKVQAIEGLGARVWRFPLRRGKILWAPLLKRLAALGVVSAMIEGGATTAGWALDERAVDKILFFYASKIIGGDGRVMIEGLGIKRVPHAIRVRRVEVEKIGGDFVVSGYL
jgi:diaminohydroxyphosphoribosylaminopyrimidine deaminase / 5-amino-6-(5-phosphoribosylamino)uracil reductase